MFKYLRGMYMARVIYDGREYVLQEGEKIRNMGADGYQWLRVLDPEGIAWRLFLTPGVCVTLEDEPAGKPKALKTK